MTKQELSSLFDDKWLIWLYSVVYSQRKILWENPSFSSFKKVRFWETLSKWKNDHFWKKNLEAWTWQSEPRGRNLYPETSGRKRIEEADMKDLDAENLDAFAYIDNIDILNLCPEKKQMQRISTLRTSTPRTRMPLTSSRDKCPWKEVDVKDLNAENWDAFIFNSNLNIHNLHLEISVLLEKMQPWRISMPRTRMPSSS